MMERRTPHPDEFELSLYADGDLPPEELDRLAGHVESCASCREYLRSVRTLGEMARELRHPLPPGTIDDVIRRRAAGERVALPVEPVAPPVAPESPAKRVSTVGRIVAAAAIVLLAFGASYVMLRPPALEATRGELHIMPEMPRPGGTLEFVYRPASFLAGGDSLRLRARARQAGDRPPRGGLIGDLRTATLRRTSDGSYRGRLPVREDDVFFAAAVEDVAGRSIDTNFGELWEVFVADESGAPSSEAIEARYRILEPYNYLMATGWAQEVTRDYPDEPIGWTLLLVHELGVHGDSLPAERLRFHQTKLDTLIARLERRPATGEQLAWLASYADRLGRDGDGDALYARLSTVEPAHPALLQRRVLELYVDDLSSGRRLTVMDSIWSAHGAGSETLMHAALREAAISGDSAAARRWLERNRRDDLASRDNVVSMLSLNPDFGEFRIRLMQEQLDSLRASGDDERPLRVGRDEYAAARRGSIAERERLLAEELLVAGDTTRAFDLYRSAAAHLWRPANLRRYADLLIASGELPQARRIVARLAADPLSGEQALSDYASILPSEGDGGRAELLALGRSEYWSILYGVLPPPRPVHGDPAVRRADGTEHRLRDFLGDRPTVLVLYNPWRGAERVLAPLRAYGESLPNVRSVLVARAGIVMLNAEPVPVSPIDELPIIEEQAREVADALSVFSTTSYVVVDVDERIIAATGDHEEAYRIAAVSTWD